MRRLRSARLLVLLLLALAPALMGALPAIRISEPRAAATRTHMPQHIEIDFDAAADDATLAVTLNGTDITPLFVVGPVVGARRQASADFVFDELLVGSNSLSASIDLAATTPTAQSDFVTVGDPYADSVISFTPGTSGGFNSASLPGVVLGAPAGTGLFLGSLDVLSLGFGGSVVVAFTDNVIADYEGVDFTVFENAILEIGAGSLTAPPFAEPGRVSVSQDGVTWFDFPCTLDPGEAPYWPGCAGVYPVLSNGTTNTPHASIPSDIPIEALVGVSILTLQNPPGSGGDSYDLADVGLTWARYVKIEAAGFATGPVGANNGGFDLDALAAVHSSPQIPSLPGLSAPGLLGLSAALTLLGGRRLARGSER